MVTNIKNFMSLSSLKIQPLTQKGKEEDEEIGVESVSYPVRKMSRVYSSYGFL